jgi:hypothetical protein
MTRKEGDNRRRSNGVGRGENQILGGSDPTLSGLAAAQRRPAPGVATAQLVQHSSSLRRQQSYKQTTQQDWIKRIRGDKDMALIPKIEPKQENKVVSARLDEEAHTLLQLCSLPRRRDARVHHWRIPETPLPSRQGVHSVA